MNFIRKIFILLGLIQSTKLSQEEFEDIEFCKKMILDEIQKVTVRSYKVKIRLSKEVLTSLIYLKIFASYLKTKKFRNVEEAWRFMNDLKGITEKVFYISNFVYRIEQSMQEEAKKAASNKNVTAQKEIKKEPIAADYLSKNGK